MAEQIAHFAGEFVARESNRRSLVTITHANISPDLKNVVIFVTILPESAETSAIHFLKRQRTEFREYLKEHGSFRYLPTVDFELDIGEKNRQRIDELTKQDRK